MLNFNQKILIILGIVILGILIVFAVNNLEKTSKTQNTAQTDQSAIQWNSNLNTAMEYGPE